MIHTHTHAPDFSLPDQSGKIHSLSDYKGRWLVIYFYPKDDTPGCTKEACSFRDFAGDLASLGVSVLGISKDTVSSHKKFAEKYSLGFPLLSDPDTTVIQAYGAWGKKTFMGRSFLGTKRMTYIVNPEGTIVKIYDTVKPDKHAEEVLKDIDVLMKIHNDGEK